MLATILSYILNREWSFKNRGGRERHHEALLFFTISGIGVLLAAAPAVHRQQRVRHPRHQVNLTTLVVVDFVLNYIIGNLLQMVFRFWALRRFAFPEENVHGSSTRELVDEAPNSIANPSSAHGLIGSARFPGSGDLRVGACLARDEERIANRAGRRRCSSSRPPSASTSARASARPTPVEPAPENPRSKMCGARSSLTPVALVRHLDAHHGLAASLLAGVLATWIRRTDDRARSRRRA